jgi:hypothetical protein
MTSKTLRPGKLPAALLRRLLQMGASMSRYSKPSSRQ